MSSDTLLVCGLATIVTDPVCIAGPSDVDLVGPSVGPSVPVIPIEPAVVGPADVAEPVSGAEIDISVNAVVVVGEDVSGTEVDGLVGAAVVGS